MGSRQRKDKAEVAILQGHAVVLPKARNIRTLSARYIADLQDHWEKHGVVALDRYLEKFPERYVENYATLARVIRMEANVQHTLNKPKTIDEALDNLESRVGAAGRQDFESFLKKHGPKPGDIIDVEVGEVE